MSGSPQGRRFGTNFLATVAAPPPFTAADFLASGVFDWLTNDTWATARTANATATPNDVTDRLNIVILRFRISFGTSRDHTTREVLRFSLGIAAGGLEH